jgi:hypothetical protein
MRHPGHARRGLAVAALVVALAAAAHAQPFTVNESTEERSYIPMYPVEGAIISNQVRRLEWEERKEQRQVVGHSRVLATHPPKHRTSRWAMVPPS